MAGLLMRTTQAAAVPGRPGSRVPALRGDFPALLPFPVTTVLISSIAPSFVEASSAQCLEPSAALGLDARPAGRVHGPPGSASAFDHPAGCRLALSSPRVPPPLSPPRRPNHIVTGGLNAKPLPVYHLTPTRLRGRSLWRRRLSLP